VGWRWIAGLLLAWTARTHQVSGGVFSEK